MTPFIGVIIWAIWWETFSWCCKLRLKIFQSRKRLYNRKSLFVLSSVLKQNPSTAWNHHPSYFFIQTSSFYIHPSFILQLLSLSACLVSLEESFSVFETLGWIYDGINIYVYWSPFFNLLLLCWFLRHTLALDWSWKYITILLTKLLL